MVKNINNPDICTETFDLSRLMDIAAMVATGKKPGQDDDFNQFEVDVWRIMDSLYSMGFYAAQNLAENDII